MVGGFEGCNLILSCVWGSPECSCRLNIALPEYIRDTKEHVPAQVVDSLKLVEYIPDI
jgi:hypothetical protein